jgi:hypothetical protein
MNWRELLAVKDLNLVVLNLVTGIETSRNNRAVGMPSRRGACRSPN